MLYLRIVDMRADIPRVETVAVAPNRRVLLAAGVAALVVLLFAIYWPSMRGGFLWDDDDHLTGNTAVNSPDGLHQIWSSLWVSRYYPLTLTTFWVERRVWGLVPMPFRIVNVAIHALNATLLFGLLRRLRVSGAWVGAAVWAVHPVSVETVAWISESNNTQSFLFFLLCLHSYLRYDEARRPGWCALALLSCAAAFTSKPSTVTLPAILLLLVWWRRGRWQWRDVWLGEIAGQQGRANEAIQQYLDAIQEEPRMADAYLALGQLRSQRGETERAVNCYHTVLRLRPGDADAEAAPARLQEVRWFNGSIGGDAILRAVHKVDTNSVVAHAEPSGATNGSHQ